MPDSRVSAEDVERAARALYVRDAMRSRNGDEINAPWDELWKSEQESWREDARAVLAALAVPQEGGPGRATCNDTGYFAAERWSEPGYRPVSRLPGGEATKGRLIEAANEFLFHLGLAPNLDPETEAARQELIAAVIASRSPSSDVSGQEPR